MIKTMLPGAWEFGEPAMQQVKFASGGLRGNDLRDFIKRAGHDFVSTLQHTKLHPGEVPVHLIALGATEAYNCNRNGDGFKEAACRKFHPTFVKHALFYRDHLNKDPDISYGRVIDSCYNERLRRVELLCGLNGTEKAAKLNGGLVANKELEKLANDKDIPVSMSCLVPWDYCSGCDNAARSRAEYCTEMTCKYGGLRDNIGRLFDDGHILHADNRDPKFFDISHVHRPADRTAYVLGRLEKAAAASRMVSGAEVAELLHMVAPTLAVDDPWLPAAADRQMKLAHQLARLERRVQPQPWSAACLSDVQSFVDHPTARLHPRLFKQALHALAQHGVLLPLPEFIKFATGEVIDDYVTQAAQQQLPGVYGRLLQQADLSGQLCNNPFTPDVRATQADLGWAAKLASSYSVSRLAKRAALAVIQQRTVKHLKVAGTSIAAEKMAQQYALYQLGFLGAQPENAQIDDTKSFITQQNHVI